MATRKKKQLSTFGRIVVTIVAILVLLGIFGIGSCCYSMYNNMHSNEAVEDKQNPEALASTNSSSGNNETVPKETVPVREDNSSIEETAQPVNQEQTNEAVPEKVAGVEAKGYCNSFAGYTAAIVANGGLTTQPDSYFGKAGLNVTIGIEDNDDVIIEAFKNGDIDFFYMTVNKMALVCKELKEAGVDVVIPYLTDSSTGGDGIVANADYNSIMDLQNTNIAMARNSVSTAIPVWFLNQTDLDADAVQSIVDNFVLYDSTQDAVDAFVHGDVGAVSTWDLTTALKAEESHLLFSTEEGEYLVLDALVVNKDFATKNPEVVESIIDGSIAVVNDMNSGVNEEEAYDVIRASVPDFADYDNDTLKSVLDDSKYLGYQKNLEAFTVAPGLYFDFCKIWEQLGFETDSDQNYIDTLFDESYLNNLSPKWSNENVAEESAVIADSEAVADKQALISKTVQLLFESNSADFLPGYEEEDEAMLDEFVKIAKILNRMVIKIEGNVSLTPGNKSTEFDYELSRMRAQRAKDYMVEHGIEEERIIIIGNGGDKPITSNDTDAGRRQNRNCILSIYQGEE